MRVHVICGFLGAGKTTFLLRAVGELAPRERIAVLVNEFGKVGIDGQVLRGETIDVVELPQGCICCSLRSSLLDGVQEIYARYRPDRLLIEPSGIASPAQILDAMSDLRFADQVTPGVTVAVIDAANFSKLQEVLGSFFEEQVRLAGVVIVNKIDLVEPEEMQTVIKAVEGLNQQAAIYPAQYSFVPVQEILSQPALPYEGSSPAHQHLHFDYVSIESRGSCSREFLEKFFMRLGNGDFGEVVRAKGLFVVPGGGVRIDYVLGRVETASQETTVNRFTLIGRHLRKDAIKRAIRLCMEDVLGQA